jgi:hypothetical protein
VRLSRKYPRRLSSFDPAANQNLTKLDSALRPEGPKDNSFLQHFNFVLGPDILRSAADSACSAVKNIGGWLTEN